jgi:hypothetical protein
MNSLSVAFCCLLLCNIAFAQTFKITGKVIDASTQKALDAASVVVKNSNK